MCNQSQWPRLFAVLMATTLGLPQAVAAEEQGGIRIDIPVALKEAKLVFNMDHAAFNGEKSIGLVQMRRMVDHFKKNGVTSGEAGPHYQRHHRAPGPWPDASVAGQKLARAATRTEASPLEG